MPVISPYTTHPVVMGYTDISVMGANIGETGNNGHWLNATTVIFQGSTTVSVLKTYDINTTTVTVVDGSGGNLVGGGADVWAAWLAGVGVRTSVVGFGPFPNGSSGDISQNPTLVSELGQVLFMDWPVGTLKAYEADGTLQWSTPVSPTNMALQIRQNIVAYQIASGWQLVDVTTGRVLPQWQSRLHVILTIPFTMGATVGVLEYSNGQLTIRKANQLTGLIIPTVGTEFNVDIQGVDSTHVRVAWSLTSGEARTDLVILDIDTATGTTQRGTVVGTSVVFAAGPTLEGATFDGVNAGAGVLPLQGTKVLNSAGEMTKPWRDALQKLSGSIQSAQTDINNLPVTAPPDSFGTVNNVSASQPNDTVTLTSVDGSVTITSDQGLKTVDLSVVTAGSQWIPLVTGAEPPVLVGDGSGHLVLVAYP